MGEIPRPPREVAEHEETPAEAEHRTEREQRIERMVERYSDFVSHASFKLQEMQKDAGRSTDLLSEARDLAEFWRLFFLKEFGVSEEEYEGVLHRSSSDPRE